VFDDDLVELVRQISRTAECFKAQNEQAARQINSWKSDCEMQAQQIQQMAADFSMQTIDAGAFQSSFGRFFESFPSKTQAALMTLADNGWYIDPDLSIPGISRIAKFFTPENVAEANDAMCDHFESCLDKTEQRLSEQVPGRARLLSLALGAHRRGEYALSIPVLLAQADGICQQLTGEQLYSCRKGIPKLASAPKILAISPFVRSMLSPIIEPAPISADQQHRAERVDILNRHAVLHGESTDYDNRLNSYRAISLVAYVAWILQSKGIGN
jgi:hypothetical protein